MILYRILEYLNGQYTNNKGIMPYKLIQRLKMIVLIYFIK